MIQAILFDWGGVLIDNPANELIQHCARSLEVKKENLETILPRYLDVFQKGLISENMLWKKICEALKMPEPRGASLWKEAVENVFRDKDEIFQLLQILKKQRYKLGFLSNTEIPAMEYFQENGYGRYFDAAVFSCVEKTTKPEEKIYRIALERLRVRPHNAIFIDDKPENIQGAEKIGIHGILFKTPGQLKKALNALLVNTTEIP